MKNNNKKDFKKRPAKNQRARNYKNRNNSHDSKRNDEAISDSRKPEPGDVNNPGYYYDNSTVLEQIMNFSFNEYGNVPIDLKFDDGTVVNTYNPMVASYYLSPSVPQTDDAANAFGSATLSGVTTAALRNYTFLCGSNNKTTLYPPQLVIIITLAVSSLVSMATWLSRNLGTPYLYNYRNRAYPDMLLRAAQIDADDLRKNLASYRIRFNTLLAIANKIPFPAGIPCIAKASEIYGSYYLDDDNSALAQTYVFNPLYVWTYDEVYNTQGSGLRTTDVCGTGIHQFSYYLDIFENMLSALLNSTALNAVYADIIRLQQTSKLNALLVFNPIPENFAVIPVYNSEIESWIHNAVIAGIPLASANQYDPLSSGKYTNLNDVESSANTNTIKYHPQFQRNTLLNERLFVDFDHDNVSTEDKVRATRLSFRCTSVVDSGSGKIYSDDLALMDYYINTVYVYLSSDPNYLPITFVSTAFSYNSVTKAQLVSYDSAISKFDWAPLIYYTDNPTAPQAVATVGDVDYYTILDYSEIHKMYDYEIIHYLQIG